MNGIILIDKPKTWTSFDVVAKVRGVLKAELKARNVAAKAKVGHTGTLDPLATGLLILTIGTYCKRAQELSKLDKSYEVEITLGQTSTTDDEEGDKHTTSSKVPAADEITATVLNFVGNIQQTPPVFSAIKVDGRRSYALARAGKAVELSPRTVSIYSIDDITYAYPKVTFTTHVSSGTYIRSLARDIGEALGTGAYMSNLRRVSIGTFRVPNQPLNLENVTAAEIINNLQEIR